MLAFYGYSAMKNPHVWGDQGRDEIKPENWNGYVVHNGQFMMYAGFFLAALAALDVIFDFAGWLYILILLGGLAMIFYPLAHWMHEKRVSGGPGRSIKRKSETLKNLPLGEGGPRAGRGQGVSDYSKTGHCHKLCPHQSVVGATDGFPVGKPTQTKCLCRLQTCTGIFTVVRFIPPYPPASPPLLPW
ncbi:hypothetical protein NIA69_16415 [Gemmiger formicilis]|nr:hypothetical protein [Gemmiger formicilis]